MSLELEDPKKAESRKKGSFVACSSKTNKMSIISSFGISKNVNQRLMWLQSKQKATAKWPPKQLLSRKSIHLQCLKHNNIVGRNE